MGNMATQPYILNQIYSDFYQINAIFSNIEDKCFEPETNNSAFHRNPHGNMLTGDNAECLQKSVCGALSSFFLTKETSPNITTESDAIKHYNMISLLTHKIDRFRNWSDEDILTGPTDNVLNIVKDVVSELVYKNLIPFRITPSIEEGLCLVFSKSNIIVYVEYYNDGDIGLIAEDSLNKKILMNIDLEENDVVRILNEILG